MAIYYNNQGQLEILGGIRSVDEMKVLFLDMIYPVGSIYMSLNNASPSTFLGGTWEQLEDRFLVGAGNSYASGATGGANTVTLNVNQIPSHNHAMANNGTSITTGSSGAGGFSVEGTYDGKNPKQSSYTGGGQAHENRPPYLAVYMWKRTA